MTQFSATRPDVSFIDLCQLIFKKSPTGRKVRLESLISVDIDNFLLVNIL